MDFPLTPPVFAPPESFTALSEDLLVPQDEFHIAVRTTKATVQKWISQGLLVMRHEGKVGWISVRDWMDFMRRHSQNRNRPIHH